MEPDIVSKLTAELSQPIASERQVVYILVEIRKLLELKDTLSEYRTLNLCCDWVSHPKLDRESAKRIVGWFNEYEKKYRAENVGVAQSGLPDLLEFLEHKKFRRQFIEACDASQIPSVSIARDDWWREFLRYFTHVVTDCPLQAEAERMEYVTHVTAQAVTREMTAVIMPKAQFGIQWTWHRKDIAVPNVVMSFF